jgi:hypothetical protein
MIEEIKKEKKQFISTEVNLEFGDCWAKDKPENSTPFTNHNFGMIKQVSSLSIRMAMRILQEELDRRK